MTNNMESPEARRGGTVWLVQQCESPWGWPILELRATVGPVLPDGNNLVLSVVSSRLMRNRTRPTLRGFVNVERGAIQIDFNVEVADAVIVIKFLKSTNVECDLSFVQ